MDALRKYITPVPGEAQQSKKTDQPRETKAGERGTGEGVFVFDFEGLFEKEEGTEEQLPERCAKSKQCLAFKKEGASEQCEVSWRYFPIGLINFEPFINNF